jgi:SAM-dependent methyltransferase
MDLREMPQEVARRHPWEVGRAKFFHARLAAHLRPGVRVLDVGAGDGYLAAQILAGLRGEGKVVCFDACYSDDHLKRFSAAAPIGLTFSRARPEGAFDIVLLLDVLEHVPDDRGFLSGVVRDLLLPGGIVLASVPAHPSLYTKHDAVLGHCRRYRPAEFDSLLRDTGLMIDTSGGLFHGLLPLRAGQKLGELLRGVRAQTLVNSGAESADTALTRWRAGPWVSGAVLGLLRLDNGISRICAKLGARLPGLSVWALATKR